MKDDHIRCNHSHVDAFLHADGHERDDDEFLRHLDSCVECREYLEHEAADVDVWEKLRRHLAPVDYDVAGVPEYSAATASVSGRTDGAKAVIDALAPTDNPHHLGRLGGYEITGIVGVGGMGVVLKAVDPALDRVVAIKVMAPHLANNGTARRRFSREAKAAAAVLHPNVIPIHGVSSDEAIPHLVMAYIRGGSLQKRLDREGPLPTVEILRIGSQVAAGLAAAHDQGLVHRDIKPENILLEEGVERVTLTDFGLARAVDDVSVTREGTIAGTPQYMSPEQARGESVDQQSDLFSLGSVLYALCTGRAPFRAEGTYGVIRLISDSKPTAIRELNPDIPEWLSDIIERLMAKQKQDRFRSSEEVHKLLEACLNHVQQPNVVELPEQLTRTSSKEQSLQGRRRLGWLTSLAFFAFLLGGIVYYIQTDEGTVRVEVLDESLTVAIEGHNVTMQDGNDQPIRLRAGPHKLVVIHGDNELITDNFEIQRNGKIAFKVDLLPGKVVISKEGREHWSAALPDVRPKNPNSETALKSSAGSLRRSTKLSAIAITNSCEVSGNFTAGSAEISVHNRAKEPRDVSFHYQIVFRDSRNIDDNTMLTHGEFKATVPPGGSAVNRIDGLLDLMAGMPTKDFRDLVVIRVHHKSFSHTWDRPIQPDKKFDLALLPVAIASWPSAATNLSIAKRIARVREGREGITAVARTGKHVRVSGAFTNGHACLWFFNPQGAGREEDLNYQVILRDSKSSDDISLLMEGALQLNSKSGEKYVRRIPLPDAKTYLPDNDENGTIEIRVSHQPIDLKHVPITPEEEPYVLRKTVTIASCPTDLLAFPALPTSVPGLRRLELPSPALDVSPDEKTALIVDAFGVENIPVGKPRIWSLETNKQVSVLSGLEGFYLRFVPGERPLCIAGDHRRQQVRFWDIRNETWFGDWIDHDLRAGYKPIFWPVFSPDGKTVSIASLDGEMQFWNLGGEQPVEIKPPAGKSLPKSAASEPFYVRQFSSDGAYCFAIFDAQLYVLDPATATKIAGPFPYKRLGHLGMSLPSVLYDSSSKTLVTIENSDEIKSSTLRFHSAIRNWEPVHSVVLAHEVGAVSFLGPHHVLSVGVGMRKAKAGGLTAQYVSTIVPIKPGNTPNQVLERDAYAYAFAPDGKRWFGMSTSAVYAGRLGMEEVIWKQPLPQVLKDNFYVKYQLSTESPHWVVSRRIKNEKVAVAAYSSRDGRLLLDKSGLKHVVHVKSTIAAGKEVFRYTPESLVEHRSGTQAGNSQ